MSTQNVSLTPSGYAYTSPAYPNTNLSNGNIEISSANKVVLQFNISNSIVASKINTATLNLSYKLIPAPNQTFDIDMVLVDGVYYSAAVTDGYIYNSVTHSNFNNLVTKSVSTFQRIKSGALSFFANQIDITSIVSNNVSNNILTIILEGSTSIDSFLIDTISLTLNYEEVEPIEPLIIAPSGTYENRLNTIKFEWVYKSATASTQASATIEYRKGSSGSYTALTVYNENNYYDMPANTLSEGVYEWRIKTTDSDGKTSDYSYSSFTVIDAPAIPTITTVENKCISNITWSSTNQVAYEIEVYKGDNLEYRKQVSSYENHHKPNMFFTDNQAYTIRVRVCNIYGLWSQWGSKLQVFSFTNPTKPVINVSVVNNDIVITTDTLGSILYKSDGTTFIPVHKFDDTNKFTDYCIASNVNYKYFVRSYADGYTDSNIISATTEIKGIILQNDNFSINAKKSDEQYTPYSDTLGVEKAVNMYSGRRYGVVDFGEHRSREITRDVLINESDYKVLSDAFLQGKTMVYRDSRGNLIHCLLNDLTFNNAVLDMMYKVSITVTQIEESEEISVYE